MALAAILLIGGFAALGTWQVERRAWKLALMARVDQRVHAAPAAAPAEALWPQVSEAADAYRHVQATGTFIGEADTLVQAVTELGAGFWVLTPLRLADGSTVLVNRGFITPEQRAARAQAGRATQGSAEPHGATTTVTGLLRITEPRGAFLRHNDAAANRWYSRDVQAIAAARGLSRVAPYFIDADAAPDAGNADPGHPVGGLTVVAFHNNHLVYAITWYTLALMVAGGFGVLMREELRLRRRGLGAGDAEASRG